jgi:hypothetical protein
MADETLIPLAQLLVGSAFWYFVLFSFLIAVDVWIRGR